ncbi:sigma-70 family RNA polymerase sigma factor [Streptomyces luteolus]|uniref:Sigma-70 family RNA polymerase sigma factor n=1 Tax=Streptomyces luteolus TaxID=3043615 RepID=A0ABT6SZR6_9ACTN|nr:sigma-70 family RNA polymerase sigma factor [Streptomyces sp. B-S-A12]MDI3420132.1 sigma-70 family RNA polymerase sigma factor [Streptomyces sp. B-S-A12]
MSKLAHAGVVRLHGLGDADARQLSAEFPITKPLPAAPSKRMGSGRPASQPSSQRGRGTGRGGAAAFSALDPSLARAVDAARAVLEEDRWRAESGRFLLKAEEEVGLAVLLRGATGDLSRDVPADELAALARDSERRRAYECLVLHNRRLVWKLVQAYQGHGLDLEDMEQHGMLGLMRAARKFDATKGFKFSTYASSWIRQSITRALADEGTVIRLPVHMHEKVQKVAVIERRLAVQGRARTVENVAFLADLTFEEVELVRKVSRTTDSLDRIIGDDLALGDLVIGPSRLPGPYAVLVRKEFQERLRAVLETFGERDRHVLVRRLGLDGDEPSRLEEIGRVFGVTRERIRQVEGKAKIVFRIRLEQARLIPPPSSTT